MKVFTSPKRRLATLVGGVVLALAAVVTAILTRPPSVAEKNESDSNQPGGITQDDANGESPRRITNEFGMEFVEIPAGRFVMGSTRGDEDEQPHEVHITRPFFLGVTEVTSRYEILIGIASGKMNREEYGTPSVDRQFATCINSWQEATHLATSLSQVDPDYDYRLPTEAEWEYACRGQADAETPAKDDAPIRQLRRPEYGSIQPVKLEPPNAFGLHDMLRNVGEYCADWYAADYYDRSPLKDPTGPQYWEVEGAIGIRKMKVKVVRGLGGGGRNKGGTYSAWRRDFAPPRGDGNIVIGVRLVLEKKE